MGSASRWRGGCAARPRRTASRSSTSASAGYDLAYALVRRSDRVILVDACPRGEPPGTLFVIEPDLEDLDAARRRAAVLDAHDLNPVDVLRLARSLGGELGPVVVVGCEPATLGPAEGQMGLSEPVQAAVDEAVTLIEGLVARFLHQGA